MSSDSNPLDSAERFQQEYAVSLAAFIVGCLVMEGVIPLVPFKDDDSAPRDLSLMTDKNTVDTATRIIAATLKGRLDSDFKGVPLQW